MSHEILQMIEVMEGFYLVFMALPCSLLFTTLISPYGDGFIIVLKIILLNLLSMLALAIIVSVIGVIPL